MIVTFNLMTAIAWVVVVYLWGRFSLGIIGLGGLSCAEDWKVWACLIINTAIWFAIGYYGINLLNHINIVWK